MGSRVIMPFKTDWRFIEGNYAGAEKMDYNDEHWRLLQVPHDWSIEKSFDPHMACNDEALKKEGTCS
ncbi:hypothetical protein NSS94_03495 [Paenibacillus sp. FSL L8-0644]|uniref:hypothetical protein n=1 Tax=Paenibacillus TaxID=44249 RepID=UPI0004D4E47F|nr:hypothetical protein [Paenibacillus polymyxa]KEO79807.1 hypothetical protein EL23_05650 [Paenibacillus polymyxa]MCH6188380.1 hypothetical protein [Paenibacillus polymyxa]WRL61270.1 hypothetical protein U3G77_24825 [Paenibacillus polymyxa]